MKGYTRARYTIVVRQRQRTIYLGRERFVATAERRTHPGVVLMVVGL